MRRLGGGAERRTPNEEGSSLILALVFLVVVGLLGGALATFTTTNLADTSQLQSVQARDFAAEAAVQVAIQKLRAATPIGSTPGYGSPACPALAVTVPAAGPGGSTVSESLQVLCGFGTAALPFERQVVFAACPSSAAASSCLTAPSGNPYQPEPGTAAYVVATTLFTDLAPGCTMPTPASCFVPGYRVNVTAWDMRGADS